MTFCVAMKVREGLIGIADTRITTGTVAITARKVSVFQHDNHSMFLMTSGLRSVRDKALTYFEEMLGERDQNFDKLYKAVNAFGEQLRRVQQEDQEALATGGLFFDLHVLIGGQLENDKEHKLYMLYPQANWVEVSQGTPYYLIGESSYGKPLLDRVLTYERPLEYALKVGHLAFDSTRRAATDVDYPIDVVVYRAGTYQMIERRYTREDLNQISQWWQQQLSEAVNLIPSEWANELMTHVPSGPPLQTQNQRFPEQQNQPGPLPPQQS